MSAEVEARYRKTLAEAVSAGHRVLARGGLSQDAVIAAIVIMEDSPLFNAGRGAVFTNEGEIELDASIMLGEDLNAGAVTGVKKVRNPILLAERIMSNSPHVMLMGEVLRPSRRPSNSSLSIMNTFTRSGVFSSLSTPSRMIRILRPSNP